MSMSSVSFVIELLDDFTGRMVEKTEFAFMVNGKWTKPIRKEEGYYVFINLPGDSFTITIVGPKYCDNVITLQRSATPYAVRLYRNGGYFPDCDYIKEQGAPSEIIRKVCCDEPVLKIKEIKRQGDQTHVVIGGYGIKNLTGLMFCLAKGKTKEYFILSERASSVCYVTNPTIKHKYDEGTVLQRCFTGICNHEGECFIPITKGMTI